MKIEDGKNIRVEYIDYICIAEDDVNYNIYINKKDITAIESAINVNGHYLVIHNSLYENVRLEDITNQPTWTSNQAGVDKSVADVINWAVTDYILLKSDTGETVWKITVGDSGVLTTTLQ